ncbi:MAG TPA: hypothetical protein VFV35_05490 [Acidimicrobiales bacterium]|nr:hypothetical protein [Acidimicrobiales bacterium]
MAGGSGGALNLDLDGSHLRVDALDARMVSLVGGGSGPSTITVQPASGEALSGDLPAEARQATFRIRDALTVEAASTAAFVALAGEDRTVVISYAGEVTVVPGGDDRFALAPNEALVVGSAGTTPSVVGVADLTADAYPEVADLIDAAADAAFGAGEPARDRAVAPPAAAASIEERAPAEPAPPGEEVADVAATPGDRTPSGAAKAAKAAKKAAKAAAPAGSRRKKAKKGRPQPQRGGGPAKGTAATASATTSPTGGSGKGGAGKGGAGNGGGGDGGGGNGGKGHDGDSYEDTPRDRRFLVGAVLVALVLAVGAVLLLSSVDDGGETEVASESTTTEAGTADTTTSTAVTTTAPPATTTSTSQPTTTTARATTTTAAPSRYEIEPKSCVQEGASITYVASVRNTADVPYDFTMEVAFVTPDGSRVAEATANVSRLGAGRSADLSATGRSNRDLAGSGAQCQLTRFDATPSG